MGRATFLLTLLCLAASAPAATVATLVDRMLAAGDYNRINELAEELRALAKPADLSLLVDRVHSCQDELETIKIYAATRLVIAIGDLAAPASAAALARLLAHRVPKVSVAALAQLQSHQHQGWSDAFVARLSLAGLTDGERYGLLLGLRPDALPADLLGKLAPLAPELAGEPARVALYELLAGSGDSRHRPLLERTLTMEQPARVHAAARLGLVLLGDETAVPQVIEAHAGRKWSSEEIARLRATNGWRQSPTEGQRQLLIALLGRAAATPAELEDSDIALLVADALQSRELRALAALRGLAVSAAEGVAAAAVEALLELTPEEERAPLLATLASSTSRGVQVMVAAAQLRGREPAAASVELLVGALADPPPGLQLLQVEPLLLAHKQRRAIVPLVHALTTCDWQHREQVTRVLQKHLDSFHPYGTPQLADLGMAGNAPPELVQRIADVLLQWLEEQ